MIGRSAPARDGLASAVLVAAALAVAPAAAQDNLFAAVATVGDSMITGYDLDQRVRIKLLERGGEDREALEEEALNDLVDAHLIAEEARRIGLAVSEEEVDARVDALFGSSPEEWAQRLAERGIDRESVRQSLQVQLLWQALLQQRFGAQIRQEIDDSEIERIVRSVEREQVVAHHIFVIQVPHESEGQRSRARDLAADIRQRLVEGQSFADLARRVSRGGNAENGGEVGWRSDFELTPDLRRVVGGLPVGAVSEPVPVNGTPDALLVHVADRRVAAAEGIEPWRFFITQYTFPFTEESVATEEEAHGALEEIRQSEDACGAQPPTADGVVRDDIEDVDLLDLPPNLRPEVLALEVGEATPLVLEERGAWFLVLCARNGGIPTERMEEFQQRAISFLTASRLGQLGETWLAQLRAKAVVQRSEP